MTHAPKTRPGPDKPTSRVRRKPTSRDPETEASKNNDGEDTLPQHDAAVSQAVGDTPAEAEAPPVYDTWTGGPPGFGNPPKSGQFPKNTSGNPSGKSKAPPPVLPGSINSLIGKTFIEALSKYLRTPIGKLTPSQDDLAVDVIALQIVTGAIKSNARCQKLIIDCFVEKQWSSERYRELDPRAYEAESLGDMVRAITDPTMTDARLNEKLRIIAEGKHLSTLAADNPLEPLPRLPPPPRKRASRSRKRLD